MPFDEGWRKIFEKSSDRLFSRRPEWMYPNDLELFVKYNFRSLYVTNKV
jgi:hypothetical protein